MTIGIIQLSAANSPDQGEQGGGVYLLEANIWSPSYGTDPSLRTLDKPAASTADYYFVDGWYDCCPFDLRQYGTWGAAVEAAKGYRYVWFPAPDHPCDGSAAVQDGGWAGDGIATYAAFSNDPAVFPAADTMFRLFRGGVDESVDGFPLGSSNYAPSFLSRFVYNPDSSSNPAYLYVVAGNNPDSGQFCLAASSGNLLDAEITALSISHPVGTFGGLTWYQQIYRLGANNWESWGGGSQTINVGQIAKWTSTDDGLNFTIGAVCDIGYHGVRYNQLGGGSLRVDLNGVTYSTVRVDTRGTVITSVTSGAGGVCKVVINTEGTTFEFQVGDSVIVENVLGAIQANGTWTISAKPTSTTIELAGTTFASTYLSGGTIRPNTTYGQYVGLVPISSTTGSRITSSSLPVIAISNNYAGDFPGPTYLQTCPNYTEDGVTLMYALHGFFGDVGVTNRGYLPENGGGLNEQYVDVYYYVTNSSAATASAPFGVKAKCSSGVATVSWYNCPPGRSYRIFRGTSSSSQGTTVGDSTGTSITDSPTVGSQYWYRVASLSSGVEQQDRVVTTYVS